jgi:hypothetical protein
MLSGLFGVPPKHTSVPFEERAKQAGRATAAVLREYGLLKN